MKLMAIKFLLIFSSLVLIMWIILNITMLPYFKDGPIDWDRLPPAMLVPQVPSDYVNPFGFQSNEWIDPQRCLAENKLPTADEDHQIKLRISELRRQNFWTAETMTRHINASANYLINDVSYLSDPLNMKDDLVALKGFKYCQMLDNSVFRRSVRFDPTFTRNISILEDFIAGNLTNIDLYTPGRFMEFIDILAEQVVEDLYEYRRADAEQTEESHLRRLGCWMAAGGRNAYFQYSKEPLLHWISGRGWFPRMSWSAPAVDFKIPLLTTDGQQGFLDTHSSDIKSRKFKHYPLAFTLLAHNNLNGIKYLIEELHSPETFIMIHIDAKFPDFRQSVIEMIKSNSKWLDNVHVTRESHKSGWGLVGIVHGQLTAYFEMLDMITFEYVINLSSNDAILMKKGDIYKLLKDSQANYLQPLKSKCTKRDSADTFDRANRQVTLISKTVKPLFADGNYSYISPQLETLRISTPHGYKWYLTEQWNILTYAFVKYLRHDPIAPTILAPLEYGFFIDELYFSLYSQWSRVWSYTVEPRNYRCIVYDNTRLSGPTNITMSKYYYLLSCMPSKAIIARKWYIDANPEMIPMFKQLQQNDRRYPMYTLFFGMFLSIAFISLIYARKPIIRILRTCLHSIY